MYSDSELEPASVVRCDEDGAVMLSTTDLSVLHDCHVRDGDKVTLASLSIPRAETVFK